MDDHDDGDNDGDDHHDDGHDDDDGDNDNDGKYAGPHRMRRSLWCRCNPCGHRCHHHVALLLTTPCVCVGVIYKIFMFFICRHLLGVDLCLFRWMLFAAAVGIGLRSVGFQCCNKKK